MVVRVFELDRSTDVFFSPFYQIIEEIQNTYRKDVYVPCPKASVTHEKAATKNPLVHFSRDKIDNSKGLVSMFESCIKKFSKNSTLYGWELEDKNKEKWEKEISLVVEALIQRSPTWSRTESSPIVQLHGLKVGETSKDAEPTVLISCRSKPYRSQIRYLIRKSGVLGHSKFKVMTLNTYPKLGQPNSDNLALPDNNVDLRLTISPRGTYYYS
jgi:hypothetical protein